MRDKREIRIKCSHIRTLRNSLREILYLEWDKRSCDIISAKLNIWDSSMTLNEKNDLHAKLQSELGKNDIIIKSSIIMCGWCRQRDKDMIYNLTNDQWFCFECYHKHTEDILSAKSFIY